MSVDAWLARFAAELPEMGGSGLSADDRSALLDLARVAAHRSERIAAPLTTFLLGLALAGSPSEEWAARIGAIATRLDRD
ncbi:MAG: DUF6457 domain-containing protein [Chloroflexota bacterium]|nr:DUF6457 domain-containing protein [Chloroflexota bacterium]